MDVKDEGVKKVEGVADEDREEILLFIKEVSGAKVRIKEAELNRSLVAADIPKCFCLFDSKDRECTLCIISDACVLWSERKVISKDAESGVGENIAGADTKNEREVKVMDPKEKGKEKEVQASAPAAEAPKAETPSGTAETKTEKRGRKPKEHMTFEQTLEKVKAADGKTLSSVVDKMLVEGGTVDEIAAKIKVVADERKAKTYQNRRDIVTHIKFREKEGWVFSWGEKDHVKLSGVN